VTEIFRFNEYTIQSGTLRCRKVEEESIPLLVAGSSRSHDKVVKGC
jgi:hypothetical protein